METTDQSNSNPTHPTATTPPTPLTGTTAEVTRSGSHIGAPRARAVRAVIADCMARRAAGEILGDDLVVAAHAELMPELGRELSLLGLIERARGRAASHTGVPASLSGSRTSRGDRTSSNTDRADRAHAQIDERFPPGYDPIREVHRGGQGVVFEAVQRTTGRRVAIKIRHENLLPGSSHLDRFEREVEILAQLDHPNIVKVIDSGVHMGRAYYVMDFVEGHPLDTYATQAATSLSVREVLALFEKITAAVAAAHVRGVIHRDLKPANILVDSAGEPRLVDFGLARLSSAFQHASGFGEDPTETIAGQFLGSVPWASPEQAEGDPMRIDVRSDVYSLGVVLFQMLTGRMPYELPTGDESRGSAGLRRALEIVRTSSTPRPSSLRRGIDPDIDTIVLKCLSKEPHRRYQSAAELAEDVRRHLEHRPIAARPPSISYQLRRFVRRNRVVVAGAGAVGAALLVGAATTLVQLSRARAAEKLAKERAVEAERRSYAANISAAQMELRAGEGRASVARLAAAPASERDWEWRYLLAQTDHSEQPFRSPEPVGFIRAIADQGAVVGGCRSGTLRRWDTRTGRQAWEAPSAELAVALSVSPDGRRIASLNPTELFIHDAASGSVIRRTTFGDTPTIGAAAFGPDATRLALGGRDTWGLHLVNTDSGEELATSGPLQSHAMSVEFTPDGARLVCAEPPDLVVRSASDLSVIKRIALESKRFKGKPALSISPDGRTAAVTRVENIVLYDLETGRRLGEFRGHTRHVQDLSFSPDGATLISCGDDAAVRVWDVPTFMCRRVLLGHTARTYRACLDPQTGYLFSCSAAEPSFRVWRASAGSPYLPIDLPNDAELLGIEAASGRTLCSTAEGLAACTTTFGGTTLQTLIPRQSSVQMIVDPGGRYAASLDKDNTCRVWRIADASLVGEHPCPNDDPLAVLSVDGRLMAFHKPAHEKQPRMDEGADRGQVRVVETETGASRSITVPGGLPPILVFGATPGTLFSAGLDWCVREWDTTTGTEKRVILRSDEHRRVFAIAPDPSGPRLATADLTGSIRLWSLDTGRELLTIGDSSTPPVFSLAFSPDGQRLAAGGEDGTIRLFDTRSGEELLTLRGHDLFVERLMFSGDGGWLLSTSHGGRGFLWDGRPHPEPPAPRD